MGKIVVSEFISLDGVVQDRAAPRLGLSPLPPAAVAGLVAAVAVILTIIASTTTVHRDVT